jgi:hypothetical protein
MFELTGQNKVSFLRCCLTLWNKSILDNSAYHDDAAFFRNAVNPNVIEPAATDGIREPRNEELPFPFPYFVRGIGTDLPMQNPESSPITISVKDSVIRGEGAVLQCDVPQEIHCEAENSLIALAKPFVQTEDSKRTEPLTSAVQIRFNRTTFYSRIAFARQMKSSAETRPLRLNVEANQSVFYLNNAPLAVFCWTNSLSDIYDDFKWSGQKNYFQGVSPLWRFRPSPLSSEGGLDYEMKLSEWLKLFYPLGETGRNFIVKTDKLRFSESSKPANQILPRDMLPEFLSDALATEEERNTTGISFENPDWMPRSWTGGE